MAVQISVLASDVYHSRNLWTGADHRVETVTGLSMPIFRSQVQSLLVALRQAFDVILICHL